MLFFLERCSATCQPHRPLHTHIVHAPRCYMASASLSLVKTRLTGSWIHAHLQHRSRVRTAPAALWYPRHHRLSSLVRAGGCMPRKSCLRCSKTSSPPPPADSCRRSASIVHHQSFLVYRHVGEWPFPRSPLLCARRSNHWTFRRGRFASDDASLSRLTDARAENPQPEWRAQSLFRSKIPVGYTARVFVHVDVWTPYGWWSNTRNENFSSVPSRHRCLSVLALLSTFKIRVHLACVFRWSSRM